MTEQAFSQNGLGSFTIELDAEYYSTQAIKNTIYDYTKFAWINISNNISEKKVIIHFSLKKIVENEFIFKSNFTNDVLDHQIRTDLENRFHKIREIIIAQAFAPCNELDSIVNEILHDSSI